jgi:hypothetical protein
LKTCGLALLRGVSRGIQPGADPLPPSQQRCMVHGSGPIPPAAEQHHHQGVQLLERQAAYPGQPAGQAVRSCQAASAVGRGCHVGHHREGREEQLLLVHLCNGTRRGGRLFSWGPCRQKRISSGQGALTLGWWWLPVVRPGGVWHVFRSSVRSEAKELNDQDYSTCGPSVLGMPLCTRCNRPPTHSARMHQAWCCSSQASRGV